ncbi:hypothetical protein FHW84_003796 [Dyella sp. SG562]|uniref:hypothetical protein n=1 Tax=Dyella sp. SG562 TaxID=2587017 RepID=UPI00141D9B10|nr:hypothetical protein [Dyella sp. SG562]NII75198.1 hypothetical protein [Dyella sp. SG562]
MVEEQGAEAAGLPPQGDSQVGTPTVSQVLKDSISVEDSIKLALAQLDEARRAAEAILVDINSKADALRLVSSTASSSAARVDAVQTTVEGHLKVVQAAQAESEKLRGELAQAVAKATADVAGIDGLKSRGQSASDDAVRMATEISSAKSNAEASAGAITEALKASQQASKDTKALADKASKLEAAIVYYEQRLTKLIEDSDQQLKTIVGLLPGATSAGLAHAFNSRAETFKMPQRRWQWVFIGSLFALIALGLTGLWHALTSQTVLSYDELVRLWLARLPVAAALLWLTLHSGRESALAKRLEEDYGYKSAISSSFEGFRQQMKEVGESAGEGSPLAKLCQDTLATVSNPPGRIYDRHKLTISPSQEISTIVAAVVAAIKKESKKDDG